MISLALSNVTKYFGARPVLQGVSWEIQDDEVIGLVGPNGAGKSTLLKLIIGEEETDGGSVIRSRDVTIGYLAQTPEFDADRTALDEVLAADDELAAIEAELQRHEASMGQPAVYGFLGGFLFDHQLAGKQISTLSGGEKSRLQMAKLMLMGANLLMLDEPTNNLDIPSAELLEQALDDYAGTVFVISHDRYFLDRVVDRVVELDDGELTEFAGGYADYREQKAAMREGA